MPSPGELRLPDLSREPYEWFAFLTMPPVCHVLLVVTVEDTPSRYVRRTQDQHRASYLGDRLFIEAQAGRLLSLPLGQITAERPQLAASVRAFAPLASLAPGVRNRVDGPG